MKQEKQAGLQSEIYELLHDMVYILAVVTLTFVFLMRMVSVNGPSMTSTLLDGDRLTLLSNTIYTEPKAGDVVVAAVPTYENGEALVKRVIATGGQTVDIQYDAMGVATVYVDGQALDEPYINETMYRAAYGTIEFPVTVPEGFVFVMGDNRNHSADSRYPPIGIFDQRYVLGKVLMVVWPGRENADDRRDFHRLGTVH
ncbi:MAG: signal peptidase I [Oscillospiraceae bacterium]|nr:signal peptidase I [Oscillospiraceae bacterium]